jgi:hypothetical protein
LGYDQRWIGPVNDPPINGSISVNPFVDKRRDHASGEALFRERDTVDCFNREKGYAENVPRSLARVISEHLRRRGVFQPKDDRAPKYVLDGTLVVLYGHQPSSSDARTANLVAGPIGIAATGAGTPGHIEIGFADLRLRSVRDGTVQRLPDINYEHSGNLPEIGQCEFIYDSVDRELAKVIDNLAPQIENAARKLNHLDRRASSRL